MQHNTIRAREWVDEHADALYSFALVRVRNTETAKDLVQETLLAAWRNIENYQPELSMRAWLFSIMRNKLTDHFRSSARRATVEIQETDAGQRYYFDEADHWQKAAYPADWDRTPNRYLDTKEFYKVLQACKNKLKQVQASVFTLKYLEGLESDEICQMLQLSPANYWVLLHRAKVQLRACLEKNWFSN
jgi:RNA polymerase sigma-70 factor (ECF subfamily)